MDDVLCDPRRVRPARVSSRGTARSRRSRSCARAGIKVGLITVCTEEVELLWPETEFAGLFDAEIFSNAIGLVEARPADLPRTARALGVEPREASSSATARTTSSPARGASGCVRSSSTRPARIPLWPEVRTWDGLRVTSIPEVLEVLELC